MSLWKDLLSNLAIVAITVQIWNLSRPLVPKFNRHLSLALFGLLFGIGAVAVMCIPFQIAEGVFIDLRMVFTGLSAYFGGPLAGAITAAMAIAQRYHMGGAGMVLGILGIGASLVIGLSGSLVSSRKRLKVRSIIAMAAAQAITAPALLLAIPGATGRNAFYSAVPELPLILGLAVTMSGIAMSQELHWRRTQRMNAAYKALIDALPDCLNAKDGAGRFLLANPATAQLMRANSEQDLIGKTDFDFYPRHLAEQFAKDETALKLAGEPQVIEQSYVRPDGGVGFLETLKSPFRNEDGLLIGIITHNRDVTEKRMLQESYFKAKEQLAMAMETMADALVSFDADGTIQFCNSNFLRLFPLSANARTPGSHFRDMINLSIATGERKLKPGESPEQFIRDFAQTLLTAGMLRFELSDGRWIELESRPQPDGSCVLTYRDVSASKNAEASLVELNERLALLAMTDGLTGLRNRRAFDLALEEAATNGGRSIVLLADIDHFKAYNDLYGHPSGDDVIKAVASCLDREVSKMSGFSARYGGEEMAAILPVCDLESGFDVAVAFREAVERLAIRHEGSSYGFVSVSVGLGVVPGAGVGSVSELLQSADKALYAAKAGGRNKVKAY